MYLDLAPSDWKSRLQEQNPPAWVSNLEFLLVRVVRYAQRKRDRRTLFV